MSKPRPVIACPGTGHSPNNITLCSPCESITYILGQKPSVLVLATYTAAIKCYQYQGLWNGVRKLNPRRAFSLASNDVMAKQAPCSRHMNVTFLLLLFGLNIFPWRLSSKNFHDSHSFSWLSHHSLKSNSLYVLSLKVETKGTFSPCQEWTNAT